MASAQHQNTASELLKNEQFMKLFERALAGSSTGEKDGSSPADMLASMPKEGDPKRDAWLRDLQKKLQEESMRAAKEDLEQVHSDENGQWMFILPTPGFCIKCAVAGGGKVFINICQHERIAEPVPMSKEESADLEEGEVRYRIPLSCGQARPETDKGGRPCKVYDVIVNPATLKRCSQDHEFRRFVAALCMQWIKQKSEPTLNADEFRNLNFKAKGTLEPQRIRLSTAAKPTNAMRDEIRLPDGGNKPTAPTHAGGASGTGKLIQEVEPAAAAATSSSPSPPAQANGGVDVTAKIVLASERAEAVDEAALGDQPVVVQVKRDGAYDWSTHAKPSQNVFFRDVVPKAYLVDLYIPTVQTAREVDVRVGAKKVECYYIDELDDNGDIATAEPFLVVVFDFPVGDDIESAKFVRKTHRLKMTCVVRLPDETAAPRTAPARDAEEEEQEEERVAREKREAAWKQQQEAQKRVREEEERVMAERKGYVENLAAVESGDIPPIVKNEIDAMPKDQLPSLLHRLEGRVKRGDSVDKLLEALPEPVLETLIDYIRGKLSLEPRKKSTAPAKSASPTPTPATAEGNAEEAKAAKAAVEQKKAQAGGDDDGTRIEYNYAAKAEKLFGVAFHNRYLFALDN